MNSKNELYYEINRGTFDSQIVIEFGDKFIVISNNNETLFRLKPFCCNKPLSQSKLK